MKTVTLEQTAIILNRLNICFSEAAVKGMVQRQLLKTAPKPYNNIRDSKYNYAVDFESLMTMLMNKGFTDLDIIRILPLEIEM
ncbi:hypothetical protein [Paenibacillus sp. YPG26]|uniref:hypothetical protein n=1 Tax=Paenibacillus sp. YPG26 TaxID=2878915 RepID=UPI00203CAB5E|nr:hypothetical protein [Paenibacillus sp. YPG26]USB33900.1 hypothetical protein LDO05_03505 [Paenibacillus sp. YPG26]